MTANDNHDDFVANFNAAEVQRRMRYEKRLAMFVMLIVLVGAAVVTLAADILFGHVSVSP